MPKIIALFEPVPPPPPQGGQNCFFGRLGGVGQGSLAQPMRQLTQRFTSLPPLC